MSRRRQKKYPPLTREQQNLVVEHKWIAGRLAHGALCLTGNHTGSLTREDLESVATFALCVAAIRYKPEMGVKYSTYAWNTARGYIQHALRDHSRLVRTPRWVVDYKEKVVELVKSGKTYDQIGEQLGIDPAKALMCEMSVNNYHISYDSSPEDWCSREFIFDDDEAKAVLLSPALRDEIRNLTDAEMTMVIKFVDEVEMPDEEREWAAEKFSYLWSVAHGNTEH